MNTPQPTSIPQKRSWDELVASSGGKMMRFPSKFVNGVKGWYNDRLEFQKKVRELGKLEHQLNHQIEGVLFAMREHLAENGIEDAWSADIGVNLDAIKDGEYIVNIVQNLQK